MKNFFKWFTKPKETPQQSSEVDIKNLYATSVMFFVDYEKNVDIEYYFGDMSQKSVEILSKFIYCLSKGLILPIMIEDLVIKSKDDLNKAQFVTAVIQHLDTLYSEDKNNFTGPVVSPSSTFAKNAK